MGAIEVTVRKQDGTCKIYTKKFESDGHFDNWVKFLESRGLKVIGEKHNEATEQFPNGFDSWQETHFEISAAITDARNLGGRVEKVESEFGVGGLFELARDLSTKFETKYKGVVWGEDLVYYDELEEFLKIEL